MARALHLPQRLVLVVLAAAASGARVLLHLPQLTVMAVSAATHILPGLGAQEALAAHHLLAARLAQMAAVVAAAAVVPQQLAQWALVRMVALGLNTPSRLEEPLALAVAALAVAAHQLARAVLVDLAACMVALALPAAVGTRLLVMVGMALKALSSSPTQLA